MYYALSSHLVECFLSKCTHVRKMRSNSANWNRIRRANSAIWHASGANSASYLVANKQTQNVEFKTLRCAVLSVHSTAQRLSSAEVNTQPMSFIGVYVRPNTLLTALPLLLQFSWHWLHQRWVTTGRSATTLTDRLVACLGPKASLLHLVSFNCHFHSH